MGMAVYCAHAPESFDWDEARIGSWSCVSGQRHRLVAAITALTAAYFLIGKERSASTPGNIQTYGGLAKLDMNELCPRRDLARLGADYQLFLKLGEKSREFLCMLGHDPALRPRADREGSPPLVLSTQNVEVGAMITTLVGSLRAQNQHRETISVSLARSWKDEVGIWKAALARGECPEIHCRQKLIATLVFFAELADRECQTLEPVAQLDHLRWLEGAILERQHGFLLATRQLENARPAALRHEVEVSIRLLRAYAEEPFSKTVRSVVLNAVRQLEQVDPAGMDIHARRKVIDVLRVLEKNIRRHGDIFEHTMCERLDV